MTNPFESPDARYHPLSNDAGQHPLWPTFQPVPDGWVVALEDRDRLQCLTYVEDHWTDPSTIGVASATSDA